MTAGIAEQIKSRILISKEDEEVQSKTETGVVHGRFQILHLKQMEYILAAKMRCRRLYIGITHPDISTSQGTSPLNIHGVTRRDNPLTYFERLEILKGALEDFGVKREEYEIIPFPIGRPELIRQYAPADAVYYMSICSEWDEEKKRILDGLGLTTEVLWRRNEEERGITGTQIRELMIQGGEWKQYVPKTAAEYVKEHGITERIRRLYELYGE